MRHSSVAVARPSLTMDKEWPQLRSIHAGPCLVPWYGSGSRGRCILLLWSPTRGNNAQSACCAHEFQTLLLALEPPLFSLNDA